MTVASHQACLLYFADEEAPALRLAQAAGVTAQAIERHRFPDGELKLRLPVNAAGRLPRRVVLLRSLHLPNEKLVELLLAARTARSLGAQQLTLVAPYLAYMRQDIAFHPGEAVSQQVVGGFLRDKDFLVFSPSAYNAVGLGTTQLYNRTLVYNHKRQGVFKLGNRQFDFRMKPRFPRKLTPEFLYVDLLNNLDELAEDRNAVLRQARSKLLSFNPTRLQRAVDSFGSVAARKRLREWAGG